ncbi:hypothetical protein E2C01_008519 [Portunus trituberculatus]|uniref:Fibronectin type-III domain-containing protein n=1 Tax=Portunus trituberculatus TaxID=210409 RepID=A0A5B7D211_PORTR|nr:hypothetical protein [Portunus trituberculatus]
MTSVARIGGLAPGRQYMVGVQAVSPHGRSHFVSRTVLTWPGRDTEPPTSFQGLAGGSAAWRWTTEVFEKYELKCVTLSPRHRRGTMEPCVLWGPRGLQAHGFKSCPRYEL